MPSNTLYDETIMNELFYLASKIAWILISPTNLILLTFILSSVLLWFGKHRFAKRLLALPVIATLGIWAFPVGHLLIAPLEKQFPIQTQITQPIDGIIILGGGEDIATSLNWQQPQLNESADRFIAAAKLAQQYPNAQIYFTGGIGELGLQAKLNQPLADLSHSVPTQILNAIGIEPERIEHETLSRNTYENFANLQTAYLPKDGRFLLITSAFHMPRSVGIARQLGIKVIPYPVDFRSRRSEYRGADLQIIDHLTLLEVAWREWIGLSAYYFTNKTNQWLPSPND